MKLDKNNNGKILFRIVKNNLLSRPLASILSLLSIILASTLVLTVALYLIGTEEAEQRVLDNMQHVMYMNVTEEQVSEIASDEKTEMTVPYKPCDTEFEMDGVRFNLVYYDSIEKGIRTYILSEGAAPERYNEIVVDKAFMSALGKEASIGTALTLDLNGRTEDFIICGYTDDHYSTLNHPVRVSRAFADQSPEMKAIPYTALVRLSETSDMPVSTFTTAVYQIALDYGVERADVNINGKFEESLQDGNSSLYAIFLLSAVIALACGIVIYSIFYLSVTSRVQQIGQFLTIGMTQKQVRKMIRREGLLLNLISIPASLLISGIVSLILLPDGWNLRNYCLFGAIFSVLSVVIVQISIGKPASIASIVSPIEASRSSFSGDDSTADKTVGHHRLSPFRLALMTNRNSRKKWRFTSVSLAFGGILFMVAAVWIGAWDDEAYSRQNSFQDSEYHISYLYDHSYPRTYGITDMQLDGHLSQALKEEIEAIPHVKSVHVEQEGFGNVSYQGATFLQSFSPLTAESEEYFQLDAEGNNTYEYMAEHDAILITDKDFSENINGITFIPGDKITLNYFDGEEHTVELEIAAVSSEGVRTNTERPTFFMTDQTMKKLWGDMNTASTFYITAENYEENGDAVENAIRSLTEQYSDLSLWTLREQQIEDSGMIARQKAQIYGISAFLILFGIFNLINTVLSSIASRRKELSMLESVGMQQRQIVSMLFYENLLHMVPNMLITLIAGTLAGYEFITFMQESAGYLAFQFPVIPALLYCICLTFLPLAASALCLKTQNKVPLVDRIKYTE